MTTSKTYPHDDSSLETVSELLSELLLESPSKALEDTVMTQYCDVLVIGAGLAGLATALSLPKHLKVTVLAKEGLSACSSYYAQGGIAAVIDAEDKVADHVSDTLIAGDGLCDQQATTQILTQGSNAISWLLAHSVPFTTNDHSTQLAKTNTPSLAELHLTQEGGHGCRRVAHADDATGRHIMIRLQQQASQASNINLLPFHEALSLLTEDTDESATDRRCTGALAINTETNSVIRFNSKAVVLASGGLGQLFSRATAPNVCVGDGIMMAWEAGCSLANLEFIQFHPTGLVYKDENGSSSFLISEAVRGEGGHLLCPLTHQRFMPNYDVREELAPRDIVARAIANEIANNGLGYVHLDISHKPADFIKQHFPDIYAHCLSLGIDITKQPIPVAPTAHYTCGGVMTNASGQTDIADLYAAGEVAYTGLHGANRLASNSLLECVVVGRTIASHLAKKLDDENNLNKDQHSPDKNSLIESTPHTSLLAQFTVPSVSLNPSAETTVTPLVDFNLTQQLSGLKQLMTDNMGIKRNETCLKQALQQVIDLKQQLQLFKTQGLAAQSMSLDIFRFERLLTLASLLLQSALTRTESRGGHYREDHSSLTHAPATSIVMPLPTQTDENTKKVDNIATHTLNKPACSKPSSLVAKAS
ncbi:L-aspartate oxidase [Psychrobacter phenylpyruvicus]|uniref:L-aspartate oxidase n=2 Tax=Psychrobacter phenylpyruvicus TaxID=29432 RepID=A0A379LJR5_9GAMM|nr:L-aspartate oxidase [Psychrobacter phenylpyruvicus]SUD90002.1 L-aspartate oxidase [Psychrobacter phenylpyruvicus]